MIGKIQDMAAAAVVVSAIDKSSGANSTSHKSSQQVVKDDTYQGIDISSQGGVRDLEPSQQVRQIGRAATYGNEEDDEGQDDELIGMPEIDEEFVSEMTEELNDLMSKLNCDLE